MLPARVGSMVLKNNGGGIVRPKRARKQEIHIFPLIFKILWSTAAAADLAHFSVRVRALAI